MDSKKSLDTTKRVYISGPITNDPDYMSKFNSAEIELLSLGYTSVINPAFVAKALPDDFSHADYMEISLAELRCCEVIYLLKGWEYSTGALRELKEALDREMEVLCQ